MRLMMISLAAMTASTACVALLFLYALFVPTLPPPTASVTGLHVAKFNAPVPQMMKTAAADVQ
jgi:hypothetical protein